MSRRAACGIRQRPSLSSSPIPTKCASAASHSACRPARRPHRLRLRPHDAVAPVAFELAAIAGIEQGVVAPALGFQHHRRTPDRRRRSACPGGCAGSGAFDRASVWNRSGSPDRFLEQCGGKCEPISCRRSGCLRHRSAQPRTCRCGPPHATIGLNRSKPTSTQAVGPGCCCAPGCVPPSEKRTIKSPQRYRGNIQLYGNVR